MATESIKMPDGSFKEIGRTGMAVIDRLIFTFVIDSNDTLADFLEKKPGNNYIRTLVRSGTWKYTSSQSTTISLAPFMYGENFARINIIGDAIFGDEESPVQAHQLHNIYISATGTFNIYTIKKASGCVFYGAKVQARAEGIIFGNMDMSIDNCSAGHWKYCQNLNNCNAISMTGCSHITNCRVRERYVSCDSLNGCYAGWSVPNYMLQSNYIPGFTSCNWMSNCNVWANEHDSPGEFIRSCNYLSNCYVISSLLNGDNCIGFLSCSFMTGCKCSLPNVTDPGIQRDAMCFQECKGMHSCIVDRGNRGLCPVPFSNCCIMFGCGVFRNSTFAFDSAIYECFMDAERTIPILSNSNEGFNFVTSSSI